MKSAVKYLYHKLIFGVHKISDSLFYWLIAYPYVRLFCKNIIDNKILFISMGGYNYACNPRAISDLILKEYPEDFDIHWAFSPKIYIETDARIKALKIKSLEYYKICATAKYIISNQRLPLFMKPPKKSEQIYIQTWHGTALKKIEKDAEAILSKEWIKTAKYDSSQIDYILAGSKFMSDWYKKSFWYDGPILDIGTPRNDVFFQDPSAISLAVKDYYGMQKDDCILLYAPTFRSHTDFSVYQIDFEKLIYLLSERFSGNWKILIRLHPNLLSNPNYKTIFDFTNKNIVSATEYPDIQSLLCASDILLTDYSSSFFDYSLLDRPCFLYTRDLNKYDRGFILDINSLPFSVAETEDTLFYNIRTFSNEKYICDLERFKNSLGMLEKGSASQTLIELLLNNRKSDK